MRSGGRTAVEVADDAGDSLCTVTRLLFVAFPSEVIVSLSEEVESSPKASAAFIRDLVA